MSSAGIPYSWPAPGQPFTANHLDQMPDDGRCYEVLGGGLIATDEPGSASQSGDGRPAG